MVFWLKNGDLMKKRAKTPSENDSPGLGNDSPNAGNGSPDTDFDSPGLGNGSANAGSRDSDAGRMSPRLGSHASPISGQRFGMRGAIPRTKEATPQTQGARPQMQFVNIVLKNLSGLLYYARTPPPYCGAVKY